MNQIPENVLALYQAGQLDDAIAALTAAVKENPGSADLRFMLFCLYCFKEDFRKAQTQLAALAFAEKKAAAEMQLYQGILNAEEKRQAVLNGLEMPAFMGNPPGYAAHFLTALANGPENTPEKKLAALREISEWQPNTNSTAINGTPVQFFCESHDLLKPFLEVFMHDSYYWLPFEQIKEMSIEPPQKIQDLLWTTARFELTDGRALGGLIPTRYAGSASMENDEIKLGRMTEWQLNEQDLNLAYGQRMFLVDDNVQALLAIHEVSIEQTAG